MAEPVDCVHQGRYGSRVAATAPSEPQYIEELHGCGSGSGGAESLTEQSPINRPRCRGAQRHRPEDWNGHERKRHPNRDTGQSYRRFTYCDERGNSPRPLCSVPKGEHATERVTHDQSRLEFQRIEELVQEQDTVFANAVYTVGERTREAVAR